MLKSLVSRVRNAAEAFLYNSLVGGDWQDELESVSGPVSYESSLEEKAYVRQFTTETEADQAVRRCAEYFSLIERIEKQRNEWIVMWRDQAGGHLEAQGVLERQLIEARKIAVRAIHMLNALRKEHGLEPIIVRVSDDLEPYDSEPVGTSEKYAKRLQELYAQLPDPIDALAERAKVNAKYLTS